MKYVIFALFLLAAMPLFAEKPFRLKLAVAPFSGTNISPSTLDEVLRYSHRDIYQYEFFSVQSREKTGILLPDPHRVKGNSPLERAMAIGRLLKVDLVVTGEMNRFGETTWVELHLYDITSKKEVQSARFTYKGKDLHKRKLHSAITDLVVSLKYSKSYRKLAEQDRSNLEMIPRGMSLSLGLSSLVINVDNTVKFDSHLKYYYPFSTWFLMGGGLDFDIHLRISGVNDVGIGLPLSFKAGIPLKWFFPYIEVSIIPGIRLREHLVKMGPNTFLSVGDIHPWFTLTGEVAIGFHIFVQNRVSLFAQGKFYSVFIATDTGLAPELFAGFDVGITWMVR